MTGQISLFSKSNGLPSGFGSNGSNGSSFATTLIEGFHSRGCSAFLSYTEESHVKAFGPSEVESRRGERIRQNGSHLLHWLTFVLKRWSDLCRCCARLCLSSWAFRSSSFCFRKQSKNSSTALSPIVFGFVRSMKITAVFAYFYTIYTEYITQERNIVSSSPTRTARTVEAHISSIRYPIGHHLNQTEF